MSSIELSPEVERVESPFARRGARQADTAARLGAPRPPAEPAPSGEPAPSVDEAPGRAVTRALAKHPPRALDGLRAMTGYEEQLIEDRERWANTSALCNEILARCLGAPGSEPDAAAKASVQQLSTAERDAALVKLRRITFGDQVVSQVDCPECREVNDVGFDLKQLALDVAEICTEIEVTLADGRVARLRLPTAGDQADLLDQNLSDAAVRRSWLLARCTQDLAGSSGPFDYRVVHAWDSRARHELEAALESVIPDLDLRMRVTCSHCQHDFSAPFEIGSFFLPS